MSCMRQNGRLVAIACETVSFTGNGRFRCRRCRQIDELPDGLSGMLLMLPDQVVLIDAATGVVLHECPRLSSDSDNPEGEPPDTLDGQTQEFRAYLGAISRMLWNQ